MKIIKEIIEYMTLIKGSRLGSYLPPTSRSHPSDPTQVYESFQRVGSHGHLVALR